MPCSQVCVSMDGGLVRKLAHQEQWYRLWEDVHATDSLRSVNMCKSRQVGCLSQQVSDLLHNVGHYSTVGDSCPAGGVQYQ